ncbi:MULTISPECIES: hypothetical protein [Rodentibacter]|uniref:hypothetical protein n=1 Tax=Rodentibacter TaxID=1960084 RepID=UPI001CFE7B85|nr:hypothetical protein [Rodentibacter sp. JRC1]GJI55154.1 hypothetical protein HEMROJRC1_02660 [Rodentibacter sp. JRC1]
MKKTAIFLTALLLVGCTVSNGTSTNSRKPFNINGYEKRLNIAACNDIDDWYLDGFGVGQKHAAYKQKILAQRIAYCGETNKAAIQAWEDGFKKGTVTTVKKTKRTAPKNRKRKR